MAYPCWRDWSETSNVLFVNKPIVRVVAFCRFEDHLNPATRDVDLEIALSGAFHSSPLSAFPTRSGSLAIFTAILLASSFVSNFAADRLARQCRAISSPRARLLRVAIAPTLRPAIERDRARLPSPRAIQSAPVRQVSRFCCRPT